MAAFFDTVSKEWLVRFVEHRIGDKRIICEGGEVRFLSATRLVVGFEYESDARRFWDAPRARLEEFALALHPDKTRLIEFGRHEPREYQ